MELVINVVLAQWTFVFVFNNGIVIYYVYSQWCKGIHMLDLIYALKQQFTNINGGS